MKKIVFAIAFFAAAPALAQPVQPQQSATEQLMQIYHNLNINLAKQLDLANERAAELQRKLSAAEKPKVETPKAAIPPTPTVPKPK